MFTVKILPVDTSDRQVLDDLTWVVDSLRFSTQLNGGFGSCEIAIGAQFWWAYRYLEDRLLHHIIVANAGQVLFDGRIIAVTSEPGQLRLSCEGYWGHGQDVFMDLIYAHRGDNLVLNPSLETGTFEGPDYDSWTEADGAGSIDDETTNVAEGEHAVKFTSGSGTAPSITQWITVVAETKYELTFYTRGDGTYEGQWGIDNLNDGWIRAVAGTGVTEAAYNFIKYEFTTPVGCTGVGITFQGPSTSGGVSYFDDIKLRQVIETTTKEVIEDAIDLSVRWNPTRVYIDPENVATFVVNDGGTIDYDIDWHTNDVIEDVLKFGTNEIPPRPLYFAIWEDQKCHLFARPANESDNIKWHIHLSDLAGGQQGLATGRDGTKFGNKIAGIYSSGQGERTMTAESSDAASIAKYGTIQKRLSISSADAVIVEAFRDIALEENSVPRQSVDILLDGYVWQSGCAVPVYNIRAGDLIRLHLDPRSAYGMDQDNQIRVLFVTATDYDSTTNRMKLSLETGSTTLDILVSWMGLQGARLF